MNISRYSISRPSVIVFFIIVILLGGIYAFWGLGKREDSTFTIKSAVVVCNYPGATPQEVESLITEPLERKIRTLSSVHKITSESHFGYARLVVELNSATPPRSIPQLWDELRRKVNDARMELPEGVEDITIADDFGDVYGIYYALCSDGGFDWRELRSYTNKIATQLYALRGVEKVQVSGLAAEEIDIWISPATLQAFELRPESIVRAISGQNSVVGLGQRNAGEVNITITEGNCR